MATVHGKNTYISLDGNDLSSYLTDHNLDCESDEHDITTYGKDAHVYDGGLLKSALSLSGVYDNTAAGPKAIIEPLIGTVVTLIRRPEGTGTGLPQESVDVLVKKYTETNPVADMVKWTCDLTGSDDITRTTQ